MSPSQPAPDPRRGRQSSLLAYLRGVVVVTSVLALVGVVVPGPAGRAGARLMVAVLVVAPFSRVGWLVVRWWRRGDRRFALAGVSVVLIGGLGAVLAG